MSQVALKPIGPFVKGQIVDYVQPRMAMPRQYCDVGGYWFVVQTEPRQESLANGEISERGLVCYLPLMPQSEPHGRGRHRFVERPMLPPYLFVKCEPTADHWGRITNARGVHSLLAFDGKPVVVHEGEIEVIRLRETVEAETEAGRLLALMRKATGGKSGIKWDFAPGDRVRIKTGPFAAFYAELEAAVDPYDRVKLAISIFGRATRTELSAFDVERC